MFCLSHISRINSIFCLPRHYALCIMHGSHPKLLLDTYAAKRACNEPVSEELVELVNIIRSHSPQQLQQSSSSGGGGLSGVKPTLAGGLTRMGTSNPGRLAEMRNFSLKKGLGPSSGGGSAADRVDPELSGKILILPFYKLFPHRHIVYLCNALLYQGRWRCCAA